MTKRVSLLVTQGILLATLLAGPIHKTAILAVGLSATLYLAFVLLW